MKLRKAQITNFRSVEDSEVFDVGDITCLVGKNEAGKTAILKALHGISPTDKFKYDKTRDYSRRYVNRFNERHPDGKSPVATTWWLLEDSDVAIIEELLGPDVLTDNMVVIKSYMGNETIGNTWEVPLDEKRCLTNLISRHGLTATDKKPLAVISTTKKAVEVLKELDEQTPAQKAFVELLEGFRDNSVKKFIIDKLIENIPQFFYTSHFERMSGEVSIKKLAADKASKTLSAGDQIFLDFLEYAGTSIDELLASRKHEDLVAKCEGASNDITDEIFEFWSQNDSLRIRIELNDGRPDDPPPLNDGMVAKIRIENLNHRVTVPLSERSAGFVWFFSFLSQFKQLKKRKGRSIILLDEPGLTLHGKAQTDLLRYIEKRILPEHQVIYSTHSPFMVPTDRLADVRVVEDIVEENGSQRIVKGTKVSSDVLSVDRDTLFPLQAHLGYEVTQSLFVGKHCLLVEGPSDILYLQVASQALKKRNRTGLDRRWTICPTGGLDKVVSFASLFSGNNLDVAVLCDYGSGDKSKVERIRQSQILQTGRVLTAVDFTGKPESDIEDFFELDTYCELVNQGMSLTGTNIASADTVELASPSPRIVKKMESYCATLPIGVTDFNHYVPAEWLLRNPQVLDANEPLINVALDRFEKAFLALNSFLQ